MSLSADLLNITGAYATSYAAPEHVAAFDTVRVSSAAGSVKLFLPYGTGQAVADAINAAVAAGRDEVAA